MVLSTVYSTLPTLLLFNRSSYSAEIAKLPAWDISSSTTCFNSGGVYRTLLSKCNHSTSRGNKSTVYTNSRHFSLVLVVENILIAGYCVIEKPNFTNTYAFRKKNLPHHIPSSFVLKHCGSFRFMK